MSNLSDLARHLSRCYDVGGWERVAEEVSALLRPAQDRPAQSDPTTPPSTPGSKP